MFKFYSRNIYDWQCRLFYARFPADDIPVSRYDANHHKVVESELPESCQTKTLFTPKEKARIAIQARASPASDMQCIEAYVAGIPVKRKVPLKLLVLAKELDEQGNLKNPFCLFLRNVIGYETG